MLRLFEKYNDLKLRTKFLIAFSSLIIITVLLVSWIIYEVSVKVIKENTSVYSQFLNEQIGINLNKVTQDIESDTFEWFRSSRLNISANATNTIYDEDELLRARYIQSWVTEVLFSNDNYNTVVFLDREGQMHSVERIRGPISMQNLPDNFDLREIRERRGRANWVPGEEGTVFMSKSFFNIESSSYAGSIVIGINGDMLRNIYMSVDKLIQGEVLVLNEDGVQIVRNNNIDEASKYFMDMGYHQEDTREPTFTYNNRTYIYTILTMPYEKWKIVQIVGMHELTSGTSVIRIRTVTVLLAALCIAIALAFVLSKRITENVRLLMKSMGQLSVDFTHRVIVPRGRDEIGLLAEKFNSMTEKINELIHIVYKEQMMKQEAEYRTLQFEYKAFQAQMNPHFLYNTLETIHGLAKLKGEEEIGQMVYLLGALLRESIGKKGDFVTVEDEIDFVFKYLEIHRLMYEDRVDFRYEIDEDVLKCQVPKFILQPLVENAIQHGIELKPGKGVIRIAAGRSKDELELIVEDNGIGMSAEVIKAIEQGEISELAPRGNHTSIGLNSIRKRIVILYGTRYGVSVRSEPEEGTVVRINLPIIMEGEEDEKNSSGD